MFAVVVVTLIRLVNKMEVDPINYHDAGEESDFLKIQARDLKIDLLLKFLSKTDFDYKVETFDQGKTVTFWERDQKTVIDFFTEGRIAFCEEDQE